MDASNPFWTYWYFHIPNYLLAALIYTLIGRLVLALMVPADWQNYIWRAFLRITDPVLAAARAVTPWMIGPQLMIPIAAFWLFLLRVALLMGLAAAGVAPSLSP